MTIRDLASREVVAIPPKETLREASRLMQLHGIGSVAVVQDDALQGILTERDILRAVADFADLDNESASQRMSVLPDAFGPEMEVVEAADWMLATGYRHLPMVDEAGVVTGMLSIKDVLWGITDRTGV